MFYYCYLLLEPSPDTKSGGGTSRRVYFIDQVSTSHSLKLSSEWATQSLFQKILKLKYKQIQLTLRHHFIGRCPCYQPSGLSHLSWAPSYWKPGRSKCDKCPKNGSGHVLCNQTFGPMIKGVHSLLPKIHEDAARNIS